MAASKTDLAQNILTALRNMETTQTNSLNPLGQFSEDLATAISNYCKSFDITPDKFKVIPSSIGVNPATMSGPPSPTPLDPTTVTLGSMNTNA
jgi:hypothetical protein